MTSQDIDKLKKTGVTHVINLQTDDAIRCLDWGMLTKNYKKLSIGLTRLPMIYGNNADMRKKVKAGVEQLERLLKEHVVYVHCNAGMNRATTLVLGHMILRRGMPAE